MPPKGNPVAREASELKEKHAREMREMKELTEILQARLDAVETNQRREVVTRDVSDQEEEKEVGEENTPQGE